MEELALPDLADERTSAVEWAQDVLWASKRMNLKRLDGKTGKGRPPTTAPPGVTASQYALWQFGRDYPKEMMGQLVHKAITILQKNTRRDEDEDLIAAEEKTIGEMRSILDKAMVEELAQRNEQCQKQFSPPA